MGIGAIAVFAEALGLSALTGFTASALLFVYAVAEIAIENYPAYVESGVTDEVRKKICPVAITKVGIYKILAALYEKRYLDAIHKANLLERYEKMKEKQH